MDFASLEKNIARLSDVDLLGIIFEINFFLFPRYLSCVIYLLFYRLSTNFLSLWKASQKIKSRYNQPDGGSSSKINVKVDTCQANV